MKKWLFGMLIVMVAGVSQAGVVLGTYDFESGFAAAGVDSEVTMSVMGTNNVLTTAPNPDTPDTVGGITSETAISPSDSSPDVVNSSNILRVYGDEQGKGTENALANNDLLSFTISLTQAAIDAGKVMNIESINLDLQGYRAYSYNTVAVFSSVQGIDDGLDDKIGGMNHPLGAGTEDWATVSIDLTATADGLNTSIDDMKGLTSITIYLAPIQSSTSDTRWQELDNISVTASIVPEPATMALLGFGALAALRIRKK